MTEDQITLLLIKGAIADLPDVDQLKIHEATQKVGAVLVAYDEGHATIALALLGAELAAKAST